MRTILTYLQYGVPKNIAEDLAQKGLPVTTFKATSNENLADKYGLTLDIIELVKERIQRQSIASETIETLLENSNYTCCVCKGVKGKSYIIHHIEEYSKTQDNSESNLAVLCPTCHDLAHRNSGLTNRLTSKEILRLKATWEQQVKKHLVEAAASCGEIQDTDYINIPRITELALNVFGEELNSNWLKTPKELTGISSADELIAEKGLLSLGFEAMRVNYHYTEVFRTLTGRINFQNLDDLLQNKAIHYSDFIGTFCFYVGGLYGKKIQLPISNNSELGRL